MKTKHHPIAFLIFFFLWQNGMQASMGLIGNNNGTNYLNLYMCCMRMTNNQCHMDHIASHKPWNAPHSHAAWLAKYLKGKPERSDNYEERRAYMICLRILNFQTRQNLYAYSLIWQMVFFK
jgi:hypothetical protein